MRIPSESQRKRRGVVTESATYNLPFFDKKRRISKKVASCETISNRRQQTLDTLAALFGTKNVANMKKEEKFRIIFDRRGKTEKGAATGSVEVEVYIDNYHRKYVSTGVTCTPYEWQHAEVMLDPVRSGKIKDVVEGIKRRFAGTKVVHGRSCSAALLYESISSTKNTISGDYLIADYILGKLESRNDLRDETKQRHRVVVDALLRFKKIKKIKDLTDRNIKAFDDFLRAENPKRTASTLRNYHKTLRSYAEMMYFERHLPENPYDHVKIERGKSKERRPLTEAEVMKVRCFDAPSTYLRKARDLFIFSCYTGLAYADAQGLDFTKHVVQGDNGQYYIDGQRLKTEERFFTPILPPAMEVLERYDYKLPVMSNQRLNIALHLIEEAIGINKPLTTHVARHTFATLTLSKQVPLSVVQRLLGHSDIKTTQIYAKILDKTVMDAVGNLGSMLR